MGVGKYLDYIELINTGEEAYALIAPSNDANLNIPIRCKIIDLDINETRSSYIIQILEFYDSFEDVMKNYVATNWVYARRSSTKDNKVEERKSPNKLRYYADLHSLDDIYRILNGEDETSVLAFDDSKDREFQDYKERHFLSIDPIMVFADKEHMLSVFNDINQFCIVQKLRELKMYLSRTPYTGALKIESKDAVDKIYRKIFRKENKEILDTI